MTFVLAILFVMIGINLIVIYSKLKTIDKLYTSWREHTLHLEKHINNLSARQRDDAKSLGRAFKRIQVLEERLEAHAAELTEHHNKIDTLEINGTVYESLFEQQGLWGENSPEPSPTNLETGVVLSSNWPGPFEGDND